MSADWFTAEPFPDLLLFYEHVSKALRNTATFRNACNSENPEKTNGRGIQGGAGSSS